LPETEYTITPAGPVPTTVSVSIVYSVSGNPISSIFADQPVYVRVTVKDQYGAKMLGEQNNLSLSTANASIWDGSKFVSSLPAGLSLVYDPANGDYRVMNGATEAALNISKAGLQTITVKDTALSTDVVGSATLNVSPAITVTGVTVTEASSNGLTVTKGAVSGPFTIQLTDAYGNAINYTASKTVRITSTDDASNVSFSATSGGVPVSQFTMNGVQKFYIATSPTAFGTSHVSISVDGGPSITLTLTVK